MRAGLQQSSPATFAITGGILAAQWLKGVLAFWRGTHKEVASENEAIGQGLQPRPFNDASSRLVMDWGDGMPSADSVAARGMRMAVTSQMESTVEALLCRGKGILAADESLPTIEKRFRALGVESTEAQRRAYREMLFTTAGLGEYISGTILFDETIRQRSTAGIPLREVLASQGIIPGIKVDKGAVALAGFPGEKLTEGLDGLRERLAEYRGLGARFTKWRAVVAIGDDIPTRACTQANARALAHFAALSQEAGLVPIVEPEVLKEGTHDLQVCFTVTEKVLRSVFAHLYLQEVMLEGVIIKPNMVIPGLNCPKQASIDEVADATIQCLLHSVPAAIGGIAFLSG